MWYHEKYAILAVISPRPKHGPIYSYNRAPFNANDGRAIYPIWTTPEEYGWTYLGSL